jgi:hypothetical protein
MDRVGQNRTVTPYMAVYLVISLPKIPYKDCIYKCVWFWPNLLMNVTPFCNSAASFMLQVKDCTYVHEAI